MTATTTATATATATVTAVAQRLGDRLSVTTRFNGAHAHLGVVRGVVRPEQVEPWLRLVVPVVGQTAGAWGWTALDESDSGGTVVLRCGVPRSRLVELRAAFALLGE